MRPIANLHVPLNRQATLKRNTPACICLWSPSNSSDKNEKTFRPLGATSSRILVQAGGKVERGQREATRFNEEIPTAKGRAHGRCYIKRPPTSCYTNATPISCPTFIKHRALLHVFLTPSWSTRARHKSSKIKGRGHHSIRRARNTVNEARRPKRERHEHPTLRPYREELRRSTKRGKWKNRSGRRSSRPRVEQLRCAQFRVTQDWRSGQPDNVPDTALTRRMGLRLNVIEVRRPAACCEGAESIVSWKTLA